MNASHHMVLAISRNKMVRLCEITHNIVHRLMFCSGGDCCRRKEWSYSPRTISGIFLSNSRDNYSCFFFAFNNLFLLDSPRVKYHQFSREAIGHSNKHLHTCRKTQLSEYLWLRLCCFDTNQSHNFE